MDMNTEADILKNEMPTEEQKVNNTSEKGKKPGNTNKWRVAAGVGGVVGLAGVTLAMNEHLSKGDENDTPVDINSPALHPEPFAYARSKEIADNRHDSENGQRGHNNHEARPNHDNHSNDSGQQPGGSSEQHPTDEVQVVNYQELDYSNPIQFTGSAAISQTVDGTVMVIDVDQDGYGDIAVQIDHNSNVSDVQAFQDQSIYIGQVLPEEEMILPEEQEEQADETDHIVIPYDDDYDCNDVDIADTF